MEQQELQHLVEEVSLRFFDRPFLHEARFNARLRTTGGRYLLQSHDIELNSTYYSIFGKEELIEVIKHELCHYHLHVMGKGYQHRDADFRLLLQQVGAPRFCKVMPHMKKKRSTRQYFYQCKSCSQQYMRRKQIDTNRYVCGKCRGKLQEVKKQLDT
ncbi:SprT family protein [Ectobacillus ponti]|uniref:Protein SprT-like n=1 Tax=Ectobacillus ponti TaxID=2961894 RepID=A0AA42BT53_9BACI|nr:SprT family protein [Ectobacillus ponti]MCP8971244.1 SprT family protein [Ectobacillus ponti]